MGTYSKLFGNKKPHIPHVAKHVAAGEVDDLRKDVEEAFLESEQGALLPVFNAINCNQVQKFVAASPNTYEHTSLSGNILTFNQLTSGGTVRVAIVNEALGVDMPHGRVEVSGQDVYIYPVCDNTDTISSTGADVVGLLENGAPTSAWVELEDTAGTADTKLLVIARHKGKEPAAGGLHVMIVNPGAPGATSVSVVGTTITVTLGCDGGGAINATTNDIITAINTDGIAGHLVEAILQVGSTGLGVWADDGGGGPFTLEHGSDAHDANALLIAASSGVAGVVDDLAIGVGVLSGGTAPTAAALGVANDAVTAIKLRGSGYEGDRLRDRYTHIDAAGVNASFDIYAMDLGDTEITVTLGIDAADSATWIPATKTVALTVRLGVSDTPNAIRDLCNNPLNAAYDANVDAHICIVPRGTGLGTVTLGTALSLALVGGAAPRAHITAGGLTANDTFWVVANDSNYPKVQFLIVDDVAHANRYVEVVQATGVIKCHVEVGTTTVRELDSLIKASAAVSALVTVWQDGVGSGTVDATLNAVLGVVTLSGGDAPETSALSPTLTVGGVAAEHLGSSYSSGTYPSDTLFCATMNDFAGLVSAGFLAGDMLLMRLVVDGVLAQPVTVPLVDSL